MKVIVCITSLLFSYQVFGLPPELRDLRESARLAVRASHCASCHTPSLSPKPEALKVFNLDHKNWSSTMTDSNLGRLRWALKDATPAEIKAMGADPTRNMLTKTQVDSIVRFVDLELSFRKQKPDQRFSDIQENENPELFKLFFPKGESCVL